SVSALDKYKLVFLGDQSIGKTSIITRFVHDIFDDTYQATIGVDFLSKIINIEDQTTVRLQLWDTAGNEIFRISLPGYIRDSSVAVIVYDITTTSDPTFNNYNRLISIAEGEAKARDFGVMFIETSAKTDFNIKELFEKIVEALLGIETVSSTEQDEIVDVDLKSQSQQWSGDSAC
ncbi:ras-related protein RABH1b-like, partial [Salvia splendens]|uniref:ras-related protein RABH1b-like n=1 Tax=Salvia splendens TaxID=180675 RepID=UPI001C266150